MVVPFAVDSCYEQPPFSHVNILTPMTQQPQVLVQQPQVLVQQPQMMVQQPQMMVQQPQMMVHQPVATQHMPPAYNPAQQPQQAQVVHATHVGQPQMKG